MYDAAIKHPASEPTLGAAEWCAGSQPPQVCDKTQASRLGNLRSLAFVGLSAPQFHMGGGLRSQRKKGCGTRGVRPPDATDPTAIAVVRLARLEVDVVERDD